MIIKKDKNKNEYLLIEGGIWIRNFTNPYVNPVDINDLIGSSDIDLMVENEIKNQKKIYQQIETEEPIHEKILVVGTGYEFIEKQKFLEDISNEITIIGVNDILNNWKINKRMNYYITNNPYQECLAYYPKGKLFWPKCIASCRTNANFLAAYQQGLIYLYTPVSNKRYTCVENDNRWLIDDYRNPICAAIGLSFKFKVKKILLFTCDEGYEDYRPGTEKTKSNFWIYPQQKLAHNLIDGNLYWLRKAGIKTGFLSNILDYENADYINEKEINNFFMN